MLRNMPPGTYSNRPSGQMPQQNMVQTSKASLTSPASKPARAEAKPKKKRPGQGTRARRKKALERERRLQEQQEAQGIVPTSSGPPGLSLSTNLAEPTQEDLLSARAQKLFFSYLGDDEEQEEPEDTFEDINDAVAGSLLAEKSYVPLAYSRRPSAAEWLQRQKYEQNRRDFGEVFAGGDLALHPALVQPDNNTPGSPRQSHVASARGRPRRLSASQWLTRRNSIKIGASMEQMQIAGSPQTTTRNPPPPPPPEALPAPPAVHHQVDAQCFYGPAPPPPPGLPPPMPEPTEKPGFQRSRSELQAIIDQRVSAPAKERHQLKQQQLQSKAANTGDRFNTKWALPSNQKVMFNYTAKNIPGTPVNGESKKPTPAKDESRVETHSQRFLRRFSYSKGLPTTPSGQTPMFPADKYDAVFNSNSSSPALVR